MNNSAKSTPAKYRLKGLSLLYEDKDIIVVEKPAGLLTMGTDRDKSRTAHSILNEYVKKGDPRSKNRIYIVHRLDRETSGILIFAKNEIVKGTLQNNWEKTDKRYLTIVHGSVSPKSATISSYLAENSAFNVYSTSNPEAGKLSKTEYTLLKEHKGLSLLSIHLLTGRKHQIRVHLSEKGNPVVGDKKYGRAKDPSGTLALHAKSITFTHPVNGRLMQFETAIPDFFIRLIGKVDTELNGELAING